MSSSDPPPRAGAYKRLLGSNFDNDFKPGMLYVNKRGVRKTGLDINDQSSSACWTSKYGSVTVNTAPYQYAWAGINEAGVGARCSR